MDVDPVKHPNSSECIRCGACCHACPKHAITLGFGAGKKTEKNIGVGKQNNGTVSV